MDLAQIIETRKAKVAELDNILNKARVEERKLDDAETQAFETIKAEIEGLDKEIDTRNNNTNIIIKTKNKMENFSLLKSVRDIVEGRGHSDTTIQMIENGKQAFAKAGLSYRGQLALPMEYRANEVVAGTDSLGGYNVATDKWSLLPYLRANSVLVAAGAQYIDGLVGDISIPVMGTGSTANWKTEVEGAAISQPEFSEVTLSPKRLTTFIDVSKQFLIQESTGAELMLRQDILSAIIDKLENTILGSAAGSTTQPAGMFYGATHTFSGATSFSNVVSLETAVANNNALKNNASYIIHPSCLGNLKTTPKTATYGEIMIAQGNQINGYPYFVTTNMPTFNTSYRGILFGVMSDLVIGNWGGLDLTVDPYSQAIYGKVRLVINAYFDAAKKRSVSFAYGSHLVS